MKQIGIIICALFVLVVCLSKAVSQLQFLPNESTNVASVNWPMFQGNVARTGANLNESAITPATASSLHLLWKFTTGGYVVATPSISGGVMYVGSWDGNEYAINTSTHKQLWKKFLGITHQSKPCYDPAGVGVTSSAAVQNNVVYVGGGDGNMYALNALTGAVIWETFLGAPPYYNFASPAFYSNYIYIGLAAFCDPPYVQGKVVALNASSGSIAASIPLVPNGQTGATVWASPAVDVVTNTVYVTTGNPGSQTTAQQPYAESFVALDANTLVFKDHWQIPPAAQVNDSDFGAAPTLFDVSGVGYIGALNKNGIYYVLKRSNLAAGPVWQRLVASMPLRQGDNVASSCFNDGVIYVGSTANDTATGGRVYALNAVTDQQLWLANTAGNVQSSLLCTKGLVVDAQSDDVEVRNASNGVILFHYTTGDRVQSTPVILNGVLYIGSRDGSIYAFTPT